ncbi:MAG: phosphoenolpyruvate--protein phosphotransferase [Treponema sp. CETP13]|nr:MAG: phosphoenolpyruvate--protein phosphotransferase [Treponema sp. CETP13]
MNKFQGVSASKGIASGSAFVIKNAVKRTITKKIITQDEIENGWIRFEKARKKTIDYFTTLLTTSSKEQKNIIESYILMLSDPEFILLVKASYEKSLVCIEYILEQKVTEFANQLKMANDEYLSARADDILDVYGKVLNILTNTPETSFEQIPPNSILVADSLNPSDAIFLFKSSIKALILKEGGTNSHLSILARTYNIPLVFGIKNILTYIESGNTVIVDGNEALVFVSPNTQTIETYAKKITTENNRKNNLRSFILQNACTKDNISLSFYANIGSIDDAKLSAENGADGIGLFRTEFLFMSNATTNGLIISEEKQFETYKKVLEIMKDKPVTIRTLDAGGDKLIEAEGMPSNNEKNPLLGWRAIRFCLDRTDIFKTQLRALYRASVFGYLKIMIPLITTVEQLDFTKELIREVQEELTLEKIPFNANVPVGIMIETPSATILADIFAQKCDFFSIGTNDLTQYILCVDRENQAVSNLFQELNPAVLRQIEYTFLTSQKAKIPLSVCGEMASRSKTILPLIAMGIKDFSMSPAKLSETKEFISHFSYTTITSLKEKIQKCSTAAQVEDIVSECINAITNK